MARSSKYALPDDFELTDDLQEVQSNADTRWFYSRQGGGTFPVNWTELNADQRELFVGRVRRGELVPASGENDTPDLPEHEVEGRVARMPQMLEAGAPMAPRQGVDPRSAGLENGQVLADGATGEIRAEFDAVKDLGPEVHGDEIARVKQAAGIEARVEESLPGGGNETARGRSRRRPAQASPDA